MSVPHRKLRRRREHVNQARFLTFSCFRGIPLFLNDRIKDAFVGHLTQVVSQLDVAVLAWVIMPDHVHAIVVPDPPAVTVARFLHALKKIFAQRVIKRWRELNAPVLARIRSGDVYRFWQSGGGYDRNEVGNELIEKIAYVNRNPLRRKLVGSAVEYPWSSARAYAADSRYVVPPIAFSFVGRIDRSVL